MCPRGCVGSGTRGARSFRRESGCRRPEGGRRQGAADPVRTADEGARAAGRAMEMGRGTAGVDARRWVRAGGTGIGLARRAALGGIVSLSGALSLAIEALQIVIPSHVVDMTSVILSILGTIVGASAVMHSASESARRWITPALLMWGCVLALSAWTPPHFAWPQPPYLRPERLVPFWSYYVRTSVHDLADLLGQVLAFLPVGASWPRRPAWRSIGRSASIGLGCGAVLEVGQVFLPDRTAELTDVLAAAVGAGLDRRSGDGGSHSARRTGRHGIAQA